MELSLTPRSLAYGLFRRRWFVFKFLILCLAVDEAYLALASIKYESDAQVMVKLNFTNPDPARPDISGAGGPAMQVSDDVMKSLIMSYKNLATNHEIERELVNQMTPERLYPNLRNSWFMRHVFTGTLADRAVELLDKDIDVAQLKESNVLRISVLNQNPEVARELAGLLVSEFITRQQKVFRSPQTAFVGGQLDAAGTDTRSANSEVARFKTLHKLSSIPDERTQLLTERTDISDNLDNARSALSAAASRKRVLEESLTRFSEQATTGNGTDAMSRQLDDAQARLSAQIEHANQERIAYPENSPLVRNADIAVAQARKRLAELQSEIKQTVRSGASPVYQALQTDMLRSEAEVSAARSQVDTISADLAAINARLLELDQAEGQLRELESRAQVAQDNLTAQLQRAVESRISSDLNKSQLTSLAVIQEPTRAYEPARPRWKLATALAAFTGVFGGIVLCFLFEAMSETVGLPEQAEHALGVPVLGTFNKLAAGRR